MYDNHFERVEEKYLISNKQMKVLLNRFSKYITKDKYFKNAIHNIYFDTKQSDLIVHSLEKPIFKDKFRLRSYGTPSLDDDVFLEMKTKFKGIVGKRRIKIKLREYEDYISNHKLDENSQIWNEIDYYFNYYHLIPKIYIAYDRYSFKGIDDDNLRITFDYNLRSRNDDLDISADDHCTPYFESEQYIMEIKTIGSMPLWLVRILSEEKIVPVSFSKYGKIYEKEHIREELNYV